MRSFWLKLFECCILLKKKNLNGNQNKTNGTIKKSTKFVHSVSTQSTTSVKLPITGLIEPTVLVTQ